MRANRICSLILLCLVGQFMILSACSSGGFLDRTVRFNETVTMTTLDGRETTIKQNEDTKIPNSPVKIEAPGNVSLLIVPVTNNTGTLDVKMRRLDGWAGPELGRQVNQKLNLVLEKVVEAQKALAQKRGREALSIIESLQKDNAELTYLNFLKASAFVLIGDRSAAINSLETALAAFPDNPSGRALLRSLKGGS